MLVTSVMSSPVGPLRLVASDTGLRAVLWPNDEPERVRLAPATPGRDHPILTGTAAELEEYFDGDRTEFTVPLDPVGTPFQQRVWVALRQIPFGETTTYGRLAGSLGSPGAARAVGAANRRNPISIIVPCHRVIGANGELTGFAGGMETKRRLLELEAAVITNPG